jgi:hypothetical protein
VIALPMSDFLTADDVCHVCEVVRQGCQPHVSPWAGALSAVALERAASPLG